MLVIKERHELIALLKALGFVKYHCQDYDCREIAGSPIINQLLRETKSALRPFLEASGIKDEVRLGWGLIDKYPEYISTIKTHLSNVENWSDLSEEIKREAIIDFIEPMISSDEVVSELLNWRNNLSV